MSSNRVAAAARNGYRIPRTGRVLRELLLAEAPRAGILPRPTGPGKLLATQIAHSHCFQQIPGQSVRDDTLALTAR